VNHRQVATACVPVSGVSIDARVPRVNRRRLLLAILASAALALVCGVYAAGHAGASRAGGSTAGEHEQLSVAARLAVSRGLGADLGGYRLQRSSAGFVARNARQGLTARFDSNGATISLSGGAHASIALKAVGSGASLHRVGPAQPLVRANRVEYRRSDATEWFANGPAGVEQGFTIPARPVGATGRALTLALGVSGTLQVRRGSGGAMLLAGVGGKPALRYGELTVSDARGRTLAARMSLVHGRVLIDIDTRGARYPLTVDPLLSSAELYASAGAETEELGYSVAVSGKTVVAGAPGATVGGHASAGDAYVFTEGANGWSTSTQQTELLPSTSEANAQFGYSVAISGATIVVGAPDATDTETFSGAAYVFSEPGGGWASAPVQHQSAELGDSENEIFPEFGLSVAVSGETVVVGSPRYVNYTYPKTFKEHPETGAAFVFVQPAGGWSARPEQTQSFTLMESVAEYKEYEEEDFFGASVAIDENDGEQTVVVVAPRAKVDGNFQEGAAFIFDRPPAGWTGSPLESSPGAVLTVSSGASDDRIGEAEVESHGRTLAISGQEVVIGAPEIKDGTEEGEGAAYVFNRPAGGWASQREQSDAATLLPSDGKKDWHFGRAVAADGADVMVSGNGNGYVFSMPAGGWAGETDQSSELDGVVESVSLSPGYALVGDGALAPPAGTGHTDQGGVLAVPLGPIVTTGSSSGLTTSTATIEGSVAPNRNAVSKCSFQYGTSAYYGAEVSCAQTVVGTGIAATTVTAALSGLEPGTTYHYRAIAANSDGTSYGEDETFTTPTASQQPSSGSTGGSTTSTTTATTVAVAASGGASTSPASEELLHGCSSSPLVLNDVYIHAGRVELIGSAAKSLVGQKVKILFNERKQVASAVVKADGQYTTTAPLPPAKIRNAVSTRYSAEIGKARSLHLKLTRRLALEPPTASGATVTLTGEVTPPLTKPVAPVLVEEQLECGKTTIAKTFTPPASGRFHITITVPVTARAAIFQLKSKVAANAHATSHGFTTYSLPLPVALGG
jgi:FG-GAP repeat